ncbi:MAG: large subunit ribosomal protein [Patescibacteria group bacterium]|nr:large subunit ribosomal protein [Patescibacteria group bacterium]
MAKKTEETPEITTEEQAIVEEVIEEIVETEVATEEVVEKKTAAKAGKRSAKAAKEAEEEAEKEARKAEAATKEDAPKPKQKPRVKKYSKKQKAMREAIDFEKLYSSEEAVALVKEISKTTFDPTLEVHVRLDIDPRQADQMLRASTVLPAGTGKAVRVAVLTSDEKKAAAAKEAGAEVTSSEDLLAAIGKGTFEFDVLVATPDMMPQLGRHAKTLGPKGLMPSPKSGTVSADPANAVGEIKKGRLEIKNDANGIVHAAVGKLSFKDDDLLANLKAVLNCVQANRPSGVKGTYVKSISVSATMTPGIKLDTAELSKK